MVNDGVVNRARVLASVAALMSALPAVAQAATGVVVTERTTTNGAPRASQIHMTADRMRAEINDPSGKRQTVIFDGVAQVLHFVDAERKTVSTMTKADVEQLGSQMAGLMAQAQQMLKAMPPEQRAQMEAMMKGRGMAMPSLDAAARPEWRKTGSQQVGKWKCDTWEMVLSGQKAGEFCTVPPQTLGLRPTDFDVAKRMGEFMRSMLPQGTETLFNMGSADAQGGYSGVPVKRVSTTMGISVTSELESVVRQDVPDSIFAVPDGFQKQPLGGVLGGARGRGGR